MINILIVDDNPDDHELYRRLLRQDREHQYCFTDAETGKKGLECYYSDNPDIILLDHWLPDMEGPVFLKELIKVDNPLTVPIIMLTSNGNEQIVTRALRTGAADYLTKDVMSAKSLSRAIGNALEKFRLQAEIRQRNHELEQKNQQLQLKNEEISRFYHTLSHELKTPLTAAREFVSILLDGLAGPLTETQNEYLDIVKDSCDQMKIELNDLLDATRLDTGKLKVDLQPGGIDTILKRASDTLIPLAQNKQIQLIHTTNPDLSPVLIDNRRITQIITNLITNAVKFTQPGGEIRVEANANPTQTEHVTVSVSDTGRGIEPNELARIFERLHQPHRNDTSNESGLGLGLYICRELIHLHGGNIWVESIPQKGSTFFFTVRRANLS